MLPCSTHEHALAEANTTRASIHKCSRLEPCSVTSLSGTLARWHRTLPLNGKYTFILPFRLQALPWAFNLQSFHLPLSNAKSRPGH
jgi:hypothetical protein